ncbi:MAG: transposon-encoded TnpW family protein [Clostridia bacterium]|nr:transposon-encoded TnpW family protein [Clostridia bacterium]MBQ7862823.1 transposon-encoded TnpW family protein [Clostridia bacterium]MBQ8504446.1 transposon-encoded TnpW family protein [Clostridia bacterium]
MLISNKTDKTQDNCIIRCIGSTNYKVRVFFSETEKETMEDKILRMIQNEISTSREICDTLKVSQMSCPA